MQEFIFLWSERNEEHIDIHSVSPDEAEYVVEHAQTPYPEKIEHEKRVVWGRTRHNRFLQVIFVEVLLDDVRFDEWERLELHERVAMDKGEPAVRVIHARDLTDREKKQLRRRRRGTS